MFDLSQAEAGDRDLGSIHPKIKGLSGDIREGERVA